MKKCPICDKPAFDDVSVCFGCLCSFNDGYKKLLDGDLAKRIANEAFRARSIAERGRRDPAYIEHVIAYINKIAGIAAGFAIIG